VDNSFQAPNKPRVKITPAWLDVMIPPAWLQVAEALAALAEEHKVGAHYMRIFIAAASQMPIPLLEAVGMLCRKEITLQFDNADTATEGPPKSGLILPSGPNHHA
jgi:hypothetical protein